MSCADRVKLTTYRRHASTPKRCWIQAAARSVASTSSASAGQRARPRARTAFGERPGVHRAVLADLQLGQVEAERLGLPDQLLQLAVRLPGGSRGGQRLLDQAQIGQECPGPG